MVVLKISKEENSQFNNLGHYKVTTWKSYDDIRLGVHFNGKPVAESQYLLVERRYLAFLLDLSRELNCPFLAVDVETTDLDNQVVVSLPLNDVDNEKFLEDWLRQKVYTTLYLNTIKLTLENYILYLDGDIDAQLIHRLSDRHQLYCDDVLPKEQLTCLQVSKYNPIYRDEQGHYTREEWTDFSDVGKVFIDGKLTMIDYKKVEQAYCSVVSTFFDRSKKKVCYLVDVEYYTPPVESNLLATYEEIKQGKTCFDQSDLSDLARLILRGHIWGKIIGEELECHFGFDFYMYLITTKNLDETLNHIGQQGLFARIIDDFEY